MIPIFGSYALGFMGNKMQRPILQHHVARGTNCTNWLETCTKTAQKMKFYIKDFFSKFDPIRRKLRIWSHLLKKSSMENFIFSAVQLPYGFFEKSILLGWYSFTTEALSAKPREVDVIFV